MNKTCRLEKLIREINEAKMEVEKLRVGNKEQKNFFFGTSNLNEENYELEIVLEDNIFSCFHYISIKDVLLLDVISSKLWMVSVAELFSFAMDEQRP